MKDSQRKAMYANKVRQLEKNVQLLQNERTQILQNNEFAVGSGYDDHNTMVTDRLPRAKPHNKQAHSIP